MSVLREALRFVEEGGHLDAIPPSAAMGRHTLDFVLDDVRLRYHRGELSPAVEALFAALPGWTWDRQLRMARPVERGHFDFRPDDEVLAILSRYVEREGHTRVPKLAVVEGHRLGQWVKVRRRMYRRGELKPGLVAKLEAIPGWIWNPQPEARAA